jgi:hypothetical protein
VHFSIAFLFLYLGYKQNSKALEMQSRIKTVRMNHWQKQIEEMEKSVKATRNV